MRSHLLCSIVLVATGLLPLRAASSPSAAPESRVAIQQQRVDMLRDEIKQLDASIETRMDAAIDTLKMIGDSKDSRTKVARMKEDTGKRLLTLVRDLDRKRAALKEELRNPRLGLTPADSRGLIAAFDARIEKHTGQILALHKSMPTHKDYERYRATPGGWWGTQYERNEDYEQNERMTAKGNTQRNALLQQLDASLARLDRENRNLRAQLAATADPATRTMLTAEIARNDSLIAERRKQRQETASASETLTHPIALKEALDMDKALQVTIASLRRDYTTLFARYYSYVTELSALRNAQALAVKNTLR